MAKQIVASNTAFMRMFLEKELEKNPKWWKLIHSSEKCSDGESRKCFTKIYQLIIEGEPTNFGVKFIYDYRVKKAEADFDIVSLKVLSHQKDDDFDPKKIQQYITENTPAKAWWEVL